MLNASERTAAAEAARQHLEAARIELASVNRSLEGEDTGPFTAAGIARDVFRETLKAEKNAYGLMVALREGERAAAHAAVYGQKTIELVRHPSAKREAL